MEPLPQHIAILAEAAQRCLRAEAVPDSTAALARSLFPASAALRICLLTGDSQVLASLGSLLLPGPLRLALLPVQASAAGAAVVRRVPVYLTAEASRGLSCYDFEGGSVFCLPLLEATGRSSSGGPLPCFGALLLSLPAGARLDAQHARSLQLLAAVLAPGVREAAATVLQQCDLILGVGGVQQLLLQGGAPVAGRGDEEFPAAADSVTAAAAAEEEEEEGGSEIFLTDSEMGQEDEGWQAAEEEEGAELATGAEGEGSHEAEPQQHPEWSAGGCRGGSSRPPEDPDASAAALVVGPLPGEEAVEQLASPHGRGASWRQQQQQQGGHEGQQGAAALEPESPSMAKSKAKAEAAAAAAAALGSPGAADVSSPGLDSSSSASSLVTASGIGSQLQQLLKSSPEAVAGDTAVLLPGQREEEEARARLAGSSWHRLLRFADAELEEVFAQRLARDLWRADVASAGLLLALQLALLCTVSQLGRATLLLLTANLVALALMLVCRDVYLHHRDGFLTAAYLCSAWWQCSFAPPGSLLCPAVPLLLLGQATQGRMCVQAPLQAVLLAAAAAGLLQHRADLSPDALAQQLALGLAAAAAPLLVLYRLEARARSRFLAHVSQAAGAS